MALFRKKEEMHFRHHNKRNHNTLIVGEDTETYDYLLVTSKAKRDKNHNNVKFKVKPKKGYNGDSYYEKKLKKDLKKFFASSRLRSWHLSKSDYDEIMLLLKNKNKK